MLIETISDVCMSQVGDATTNLQRINRQGQSSRDAYRCCINQQQMASRKLIVTYTWLVNGLMFKIAGKDAAVEFSETQRMAVKGSLTCSTKETLYV